MVSSCLLWLERRPLGLSVGSVIYTDATPIQPSNRVGHRDRRICRDGPLACDGPRFPRGCGVRVLPDAFVRLLLHTAGTAVGHDGHFDVHSAALRVASDQRRISVLGEFSKDPILERRGGVGGGMVGGNTAVVHPCTIGGLWRHAFG